MKSNEFTDLNYDWEAEKKRRLKAMRRRDMKNALKDMRLEIAVLVAIFIGFVVFCIFWNRYEKVLDRSAYLEGRHNLTHTVAMQFAEKEVL